MAIFWNFLNGYLQADAISSVTSIPSPSIVASGLAIFFLGLYGNIWHDNRLAEIKRKQKGYAIPEGGLYNLIAFPTYFCEWIEWAGYAICLARPAGNLITITSNNRMVVRWFGSCSDGTESDDWS